MRLKNKNHERFCQEYVKNERNARISYKKIYGVKRNEIADAASSRLLSNVKLKKRIDELLKELENKTLEVTKERIIEEYARIAFFDPKEMFNDDGTMKDIHSLSENSARVIGGLEVENLFAGKGAGKLQIGQLKKIKIVDKKGALDSLAKIKGMFIEKVEIEVKKLLLDV